ncbi:P-loop containing nucleoside triphosphate hydrolase protein [Cryphonectria parasitica EP155]|uniref:P-loop containing nucleoside triphosphate hydrolase protein n=1 Tax=Cryphonectria parasitica (strain ATCC 38755 / EP155) TaxID=660469 RepID=A0A9P4XWU7_CRYP1|nr:P-loop containing nucleoside triphosphate hydrolase protein [Cryphonectria parasitica EP155]KAF3762368.1 P-loop containing nucleoside triphosphate hydrolase protein [Cryphonectria parasitica EP155]
MQPPGNEAVGEITETVEPSIGSETSEPNRQKHGDDNGQDGKTPAKVVTKEREAGWGDYFRCFTYARKWDFLLMAAAALASMGAGVTTPLMNVVFGRLVGGIASFGGGGSSQKSLDDSINRQCLYIFILFLARFSLNYLSKFSLRLIGIRISAAIRMHYLSSLLAQTVHVLDTMPPGAAAGTITSTANTLQIGISEKLGTAIEFTASIIAAIVIAFVYSWRVCLVTMSCILFISLAVSGALPFVIRRTERHTKAETKAGAVATEAFSAVRMIYACGAQKRMQDRYARFVIEAKQHGMSLSPIIAVQFGCIFLGLWSAFALAFWYGTRAYAEGYLGGGIGTIVVVLNNILLMAISLERISAPLVAASKATVAAATFFAVIDAPRPDSGRLKDPDVTADGDILLSGVTFAYPGRPHTKVLDGLDLKIGASKVTALVGASGSGKSTIVGLVEKWYSLHDQVVIEKAIAKEDKKKREAKEKKKKAAREDGEEGLQEEKKKSFWARLMTPSKAAPATDDEDEEDNEEEERKREENAGPPVQLSGKITTSGHSLDEIDTKFWRTQIGLVQQEPFLFNDSIYANVCHGLVGTQWEHEPLEVKQKLAEEACKEAFADEFIDKLPEGYNTVVGDAGLKLSGGQRQRLAIARSIVKKPKILILDEATSAIDVRSEKIIQAALDRVSRGRTTIMIAHRLSTIAKADNIAVLSKGKLMEQGTHEELLRNEDGVYSGLVRAQRLTLGEEDTEGPHGKKTEHNEEEEEKEEEQVIVQPVMSRHKSAALSIEATLDQTAVESSWKERGLMGSFGRLLWEQKTRIPNYTIIFFSSAVIGACMPMQAYLFAQVVNVFTIPLDGSGLFLQRASFWSLMWFVLALCNSFSYSIMAYVATSLQFFISATYRQQYFNALVRQPIRFFDAEANSVGSLTARVQSDPKQLEELLGINMGMVLASMLQMTGALAIAFAYNWKLAIVAICVTLPIGLVCAWYRFRYELAFEKLSATVFAESSKWAAEAIGAFRCVSSLTLEDEINRRYQELLRQHVVAAYRKARWSTVIFALSDSLTLACSALIFWYGGHLLARGQIGVLSFFVCYMAAIQGGEAAGMGFSFGPNAAQATAAANRILSIREKKENTTAGEEGMIPDTENGVRIELRDVSFKYPTRDGFIFKHLNITAEKGQFIALVGASGVGKSSIVSLLERFYDVQSGRILCNGQDIKDVDVYEYRKLLSLVAQEPTLFQGTIKENILLGVDSTSSSPVTDAQLHQACRDAAIHDFIVSLPEGYNTNVGSRGVALSGGQKQRIAIARAIIRDPRVLLLDEATSSLDSESEKQISAALRKVAKGRTTVAVAHRLSTIQHADVIYVLGEGRVLEVGSHAELLKKRGMYFNMCQSQALDQ